jgi:sigma-B regulation protein RsbU (phosphoserine phosphatase)
VAWLNCTDIALGFDPGRPYEPQECRLQPGDVLVMYTDGITEAFNGERRMFGGERLQAVVRAHAQEPAAELVTAIAAAVREHAGAAQQSDDMTLLVLRISGKSQQNG